MDNIESLMDISFKNKKLQNVFNASVKLKKEFGAMNAKVIMRRMAFLKAAPSLSDVPHRPPERCHQLDGRRKNQFAVDVKHPYRLVFKPDHDPMPKTKDGGIDLTRITAIEIQSIEDYH